MTLQNVETFEHDIATEIIKKESAVSKVASVENLVKDVKEEVDPTPVATSSSSMLIIISVIVAVLVAGGGYFGYTYFLQPTFTPATPAPTPKENTLAASKSAFATMFPDLDTGFGRYVSRVDKNPYGIAITITDYTPVFSYTVKNEEDLARAIARVLPTGLGGDTAYTFSDITIANQNMRVGISGSSTVAYAFVGTKTLIMSTSTEGLSAIASGILK